MNSPTVLGGRGQSPCGQSGQPKGSQVTKVRRGSRTREGKRADWGTRERRPRRQPAGSQLRAQGCKSCRCSHEMTPRLPHLPAQAWEQPHQNHPGLFPTADSLSLPRSHCIWICIFKSSLVMHLLTRATGMRVFLPVKTPCLADSPPPQLGLGLHPEFPGPGSPLQPLHPSVSPDTQPHTGPVTWQIQQGGN